MADKDKELFTKRDAVTFEEEPEEYCKKVYAEAVRRNDDLKDINKENRLFYEGVDQELIDRAQDEDVARSGLFIHELKPAIDTRKSDVIAKVEERDFPVTFRPAAVNPTDQQKDQALWIEQIVNKQLRDCGYLSDGFGDHILAAEIQRSPATVKVDWEDVYEKEPVVIRPSELQIMTAAYNRKPVPPSRVVFRDKYVGGRPYVELLDPDEFLYEPTVSNFQKDSEYAGHAIWVSWHRLMSLAKEHNWDQEKLKKFKGEIQDADESGESVNDSFRDEIEDEKETPFEHGVRDGKVLVFELYVNVYADDGTEEVWQVIFVGNKHIVSIKRSPYRGIKLPFVPITPNKLPNSIEGLSSVDVGKYMQRLYNEIFNSYLDGVSYRLFPPLIREPGTSIQKRPQWRLGAIWDVTNPDGLRPLIENPGQLPDLPPLMEAVSAKLRNALETPDIAQGFQAGQYEKATATNLRALGAAKRAVPTRKVYGEALIEVARMFLALDQQYHEQKEMFVLDVVIDVPSLTNITDPEAEKQEALLLLSQAEQSRLYQTPTGLRKLRNLQEEVYRKFKKTDIDRYVPTEEELERDIQTTTDLAVAAQQKQAIQEQLLLEQSAQPNQGG